MWLTQRVVDFSRYSGPRVVTSRLSCSRALVARTCRSPSAAAGEEQLRCEEAILSALRSPQVLPCGSASASAPSPTPGPSAALPDICWLPRGPRRRYVGGARVEGELVWHGSPRGRRSSIHGAQGGARSRCRRLRPEREEDDKFGGLFFYIFMPLGVPSNDLSCTT